jgi:hypothetical protein
MARSKQQNGSSHKEAAAKTTTAAARLDDHATDPLATPAGDRVQPGRPVRRSRLDIGDAPKPGARKATAPKTVASAPRRKPTPTAPSPSDAAANGKAKATPSGVATPTPQAATPAPRAGTKPSTPRTRPQCTAKRTSALDAAAQVLAGLGKAESNSGLTAADLIERMSKAKLWTSPGGKTPAATLYAAMTREITKKGNSSRFTRPGPGRFTASTSFGASARKNGGAK